MSTWNSLDNPTKETFYRNLVKMSLADSARSINLDESYRTESSLRATAYKLYKSIDPHELGISTDMVKLIEEKMQERKVYNPPKVLAPEEKKQLLNPEDAKGMILGGRNKAAALINKKLDRLDRSNKLLDEVTLTQLATTLGILFDKSQIIQGQATENIAVMSKISSDMSAEESLQALLKMREVQTYE